MKLKYNGNQTLQTTFAIIKKGDVIDDKRMESFKNHPDFEVIKKDKEETKQINNSNK